MSTDDAWLQLAQAVIGDDAPALLVLDEQFPGGIPAVAGLQAITNRCDVAFAAGAARLPCAINDFELSELAPIPQRIYYRISKEKALVNHIIDTALSVLPGGGELVLTGYKNEGIRSYAGNAQKICAAAVTQKKGPRSAWLVRVTKHGAPAARLDRDDYASLRQLTLGGETFFSKPGIFGWNKVDAGSALLAAQLPEVVADNVPQRVLDLGCGYGYLSLAVAALSACAVTATDNNVAAVNACRKNFAERNITGEVVLADCADGIDGKFDLVLCNPPFHRGFAVDAALIDRFLQVAASRLSRNGSALFVTHRTAKLGARAQSLFARQKVLAADNQFEITKLKSPS